MLETMAYFLILGAIAAAWLGSFIVCTILKIGSHSLVATIIGSAVGIAILLIAPLQGVLAMIAAGVCAIIAAIVLDKIW